MDRKPAVVIGIGNPYRCDDGIGPAAVVALADLRPPQADVIAADGEPAALLEAWTGRDLAVVIDAVRCEPSTPGRIWRSAGADLGGPAAAASSHALGIPDALRLGQVLDRVPGRLVVYAVEAARLDLGLGLSPEVSAALPQLIRAVLAELARPVLRKGRLWCPRLDSGCSPRPWRWVRSGPSPPRPRRPPSRHQASKDRRVRPP
jgi:hydrogenase maturation protease